MSEVREKGAVLKKAARLTALASTEEKNNALAKIADALEASCEEIIAANVLPSPSPTVCCSPRRVSKISPALCVSL